MSDRVRCENCDWVGRTDEGKEIDDLFERVDAGDVMPSCECPQCGSLCLIDQPKVVIRVIFWTEGGSQEPEEFSFDTEAEKDAFLHGIAAGLGKSSYEVADLRYAARE